MKKIEVIDIHESDAYYGSEKPVLNKIFYVQDDKVRIYKSNVGSPYVSIDDCYDEGGAFYCFHAVIIKEL